MLAVRYLVIAVAATLLVLLPGGFLEVPLSRAQHSIAQLTGNERPPMDMHLVYAVEADRAFSMRSAGTAGPPAH
jgi:hypothetical protein